MRSVPAWLLALPWLVLPLWVWLRMRASRHLHEYAPLRGAGIPRVSVIIPARNEALNIERCVRSVLLTTYANIEVIVVDDHSSDGTGDIARGVIAGDARARVTTPPPLPAGWYGKQWACAHGASLATGELLLFTDADTWHAPDLVARSAQALRERGADLLTVVGHQEAVTFWERAIQPAIFLGIMAFVGNSDALSASRQPRRKAANGQFLLMKRDVYDALDGHAAVRGYVAEDIMFAQTWTAAGRAVHLVIGLDQLSTRMYRSLDELIRGWGKNAWAGAKHNAGDSVVAQQLLRWMLPFTPLVGLIPILALILGALHIAPAGAVAFGTWAWAFETLALMAIFGTMRMPRSSAFLHPIGSAVMIYIFARASIRGDRTEWKGRENVAA
jgi:chlorobactene glucosyltransferase